MRRLKTYEEVVVWVSNRDVRWWRKRGGRISETTWTTTADLEPAQRNNATSQCAKFGELLVANAFKVTTIYLCTGKMSQSVWRIPLAQHIRERRTPSKRPHHFGMSAFVEVARTETHHCSRMPLQQLLLYLVRACRGRNMARLPAPAMRPIVEPV